MNSIKMQTVANIIFNEALNTLATVHKTDVNTIREAIVLGNKKLSSQFAELVKLGTEQASEMMV